MYIYIFLIFRREREERKGREEREWEKRSEEERRRERTRDPIKSYQNLSKLWKSY